MVVGGHEQDDSLAIDGHRSGAICPVCETAVVALRIVSMPEPRSSAGRASSGPSAVPRTRSASRRVAWACSIGGAVTGTAILGGIMMGNVAHVAAGVAPVLASAPTNLLLVTLAFAVTAWISDGLPRWLEPDLPQRTVHSKPTIWVPDPVIATCLTCHTVFADQRAQRTSDGANRTYRDQGASGTTSASIPQTSTARKLPPKRWTAHAN